MKKNSQKIQNFCQRHCASQNRQSVESTGMQSQITKDQLCAAFYIKSSYKKKRLENTEKKTLLAVQKTIKAENCGVKIQRSLEALESVGCYVPGGGARYPSSAVMSTLPAKIAGVKRIIVCSPPDESGSIDPLTLVAADICGATEIYSVGGPHAVSAMAYGTKSIAPVDKIVGPGGKYVTLAKQFVNSYTSIDMSAGPTELLIVADSKANPALNALICMCAFLTLLRRAMSGGKSPGFDCEKYFLRAASPFLDTSNAMVKMFCRSAAAYFFTSNLFRICDS